MRCPRKAVQGRNGSSLNLFDALGSGVFVGIAGTIFATLHPSGNLPLTFGVLLGVMSAVVALLAAAASLRIGAICRPSRGPAQPSASPVSASRLHELCSTTLRPAPAATRSQAGERAGRGERARLLWVGGRLRCRGGRLRCGGGGHCGRGCMVCAMRCRGAPACGRRGRLDRDPASGGPRRREHGRGGRRRPRWSCTRPAFHLPGHPSSASARIAAVGGRPSTRQASPAASRRPGSAARRARRRSGADNRRVPGDDVGHGSHQCRVAGRTASRTSPRSASTYPTRRSSAPPVACSEAMYAGVPAVIVSSDESAIDFATPRSASTTRGGASGVRWISRLPGVTSRCSTWWSCSTSMARQDCAHSRSATAGATPVLRRSSSEPPLTKSITKYGRPSGSAPMSYTATSRGSGSGAGSGPHRGSGSVRRRCRPSSQPAPSPRPGRPGRRRAPPDRRERAGAEAPDQTVAADGVHG